MKLDTFFELLELSDAILYVDNDMCYITYNVEDEDGYESKSFSFTPLDLAFIFAEKLGVTVEHV